MKWSEFSWSELAKVDRNLPVIVPLGSCEQHGHHLPLSVDAVQVDAIAQGVEAALSEEVLVVPTLWLGSSHHHLDFVGTLSVSPRLYTELIQDLTRSILAHGFRRIFFLNGHGGNLLPVSQALTDLVATDDRADAAHLCVASWWRLAAESMRAEQHGMRTACLTHACEYETSLVLALRPDLVRLALINSDSQERERPWAENPRWRGRIESFHRFHRWTASGHMGVPSEASSEKGRSLLAAVIEEIIKFTEEFSTWPDMKVVPRSPGHSPLSGQTSSK